MPGHAESSEDPLDPKRIDALLRLSTAAPDAALLCRHFAMCAGQAGAVPLTGAERRWVITNLEANPPWREHWHRLEQDLGRSVDWGGSRQQGC